MSRESHKHALDPREPNRFGSAGQPDLFGPSPEAARYVPKPEHVRSGILDLLARLAAAQTWWGWSDWEIARLRDESPRYYCDLLPDKEEAMEWMRRLRAETTRLDAASGRERPVDPSRWQRKRVPSPFEE